MLSAFFSPRSIAVVGASREPGKVGHAVLTNIRQGGYAGRLYPVNPSADAIDGIRAYPDLVSIGEPVDLAVIVVPASGVPPVIRECGRLGIRSAIVVSAGFRESGPEGAALERQLMHEAREGGVRVLGPNCLGLIATPASLNASFAPIMPAPGGISFLSQSGALGTAILDWAAGEGIGLAHFVSLGNKADISEVDLIRAWSDGRGTDVVVAYLESITDGRAFVEAVGALTQRAPFIAITAGSSDAGARAVSSHTGSLAGSRAAYAAAFEKCGAITASTVEELFDFAEGFARQPLPDGAGLAILTNAGGPAILATDACETHGVRLAKLGARTVERLREVLPAAAAVYNPVDILGDAPARRYADAAAILMEDPAVRSIVVILTPQAMTEAAATAEAVVAAAEGSRVTILGVFMGDASVAEAMDVLKRGGVPGYAFPERAIATLGAMERYRAWRDRPAHPPCAIAMDEEKVRAAIDHAREAGRTFITESSAARVGAACGLRVPRSGLATDLAGALALAADFGYPVVLKIASPDILHKSDIGGIRLGIEDAGQLSAAYEDILSHALRRLPDARIWGVSVHEQVPAGREVIIGVDRDPNFGPILMFGLGGIYVEALRDVSFRLCPVLPHEAREMIEETRSAALLRGVRGEPPADIEAIVDAICRVSALVMAFDDITELDINPLIVGERGTGATAADIRIGIGD